MLSLRLFGGLSLISSDAPVPVRASQRRRLALLAVLAMSRQRPVGRDKLVALLWPDSDSDRGRHLLADSIYVFRDSLGEDVLLTSGDSVSLNPSRVTSDVSDFAEALERRDLARAVGIYSEGGQFLDGVHLSDAPEFERWADATSRQFAGEYGRALESLAKEELSRGNPAAAVEWWRKLAAQEPSSSRVALELMRALEASGDISGALEFAGVHEKIVRAEIDAAPDPSVIAFANELRAKAKAPAARKPAETDARAGQVSAAAEVSVPVLASPAPVAPAPAVPVPGNSRSRRVAFALGIAAFLAAGLFVAYRMTRPGAGETGAVTAVPAPAPAIAVLPFANMSGSHDNEYFSDGMTEELIQALGAVHGLRVAARTSSFAFKGQNVTVQDIGRRLHVSHVVEGSVRQSGTRLRITAELIKVSDGYRVWSQSYDREPRDVFHVQDEIAHSIATALSSALGISLTAASPPHRAPRDLAAYDLYLKGRYFWNKRSPDGLRKAISYFQQAIAHDSTYALAFSGLADSYSVQAALEFVEPRTGYAMAKPAVLRALQLDSTLAEAHASLGFLHVFYDLDPPAARQEFERALALDPRYATAHLFYAWYCLSVGDFAGALREATIAHDLEPLSLAINSRLGSVLLQEGRYNEAERQIRKAIELDSTFGLAHTTLARVLALRGQYEASIASARRGIELSGPRGAGILGYSLAMSGRKAEAEGILRALIAKSRNEYVAPSGIALIYLGLGDDAKAIKWLARCYKVRDTVTPLMRVDPLFKRLHGDPRFVAMISSSPRD